MLSGPLPPIHDVYSLKKHSMSRAQYRAYSAFVPNTFSLVTAQQSLISDATLRTEVKDELRTGSEASMVAEQILGNAGTSCTRVHQINVATAGEVLARSKERLHALGPVVL